MVWRRGARQTWEDTQSLRQSEAGEANERATTSAGGSNTTTASTAIWHCLRIGWSERNPVEHGTRGDANHLRFLARA